MANEVYANNMEISCKAASGKSIAAFPDVCFTRRRRRRRRWGTDPLPQYRPVQGHHQGHRTIRITRKEVMLKNKSYYKTSYGDEPGGRRRRASLPARSRARCTSPPGR